MSGAADDGRELGRDSSFADVVLTVLNALPAMVGFWDRDLRNVLANRAYVEYFGFEPESIAGVHIRDVVGSAVFEANLPFMMRALAGEEQLFDQTLVDLGGHTHHTQTSYVPYTTGGATEGFFVLVTDVTGRVDAEWRAQRNAEQYRALAASLPDGFVLLYDPDLRFLIADGEELASFGHQSADLEGRTVREVFPESLAEELELHFRAALAGERVHWQRRVRDRTFSLKAAPVAGVDGEVFAGMVIAQDVTDVRRSQAVQAALREIATSVARNLSTEVISGQIAANLITIFNADTAAVVRYTEPGGADIVAMAPVQPRSASRALRFGDQDWSATAQVATTGQPALVTLREQDNGALGALRQQGLAAEAAAPIRYEGQLWGAIALGAHSADRLTREVVDQLAGFADLLEITLTNLKTWSTLNEQATRDPLTGLANRRSLDEHLVRELDASRRTREPLSVVVMDIDHFKTVNDRFGHPTGDRVLAEVSALLTAMARKSEMVARTGGEEFAWVLKRTGTASATQAAERARRAVAEHDFAGVGRITLSLGVCSTDSLADPANLTTAADEALYDAKLRGRNCVAVYRQRLRPR